MLSSSVDDSSVSSVTEFTGFGSTGFVILAGGTGSRMKANMPKQFMILNSCPVLYYSLHLFLEKLPTYCITNNLSLPQHVVLVIDPKYQSEYQSIVNSYQGKLSFANPGKERQGSVQNGLNELVQTTNGECTFVAIHDSARPLVTIQEVCNVVHDAHITGAAVLGVPCKATIKESVDGGILVSRTLDRSKLWEVHTPQVVRVEALLRGFDKVEKEMLEVTDDVSIIEALNEPVKLTRGEYTNLKITTPEDMDVASAILLDRGEENIHLAGAAGGVDGKGSTLPSSVSSSSSRAIGGRRA
jgi:2-C-methyl-D-erythritol 4-phosphate cytidylyltransferase